MQFVHENKAWKAFRQGLDKVAAGILDYVDICQTPAAQGAWDSIARFI
jgi:hypothetical protein